MTILLFCFGLALMLGINSPVKQNPDELNEGRFGLMQVINASTAQSREPSQCHCVS